MKLSRALPAFLLPIAIIIVACTIRVSSDVQPTEARAANHTLTNTLPPTSTASIKVETSTMIPTPIATSAPQPYVAGIFYFADRESNEDYDRIDFVRLYTDGIAVAQDACAEKGITVAEMWNRMKDFIQHEEIAFGPWAGGYNIRDNRISLLLRKVRGLGPEGELWKEYEGTYIDGDLALEGNQYQLCVECIDPLP